MLVVFGVERVVAGDVVAAVAVEAEAVAAVEVAVGIAEVQGEAWKLSSPQRSLVVVAVVVPLPLAVSPSLPSWPSSSFGHSPNSLRVEPFGAS